MNERLRTRTEFLRELRHECALRFEPEVVEAMVTEADSHLVDSIQARLELGDSPEVAELEAVAAFHHPRKFAEAIETVRESHATHDLPLFLAGLGMIFWLGLWIEIYGLNISWYFWLLGMFVSVSIVLIRSAALGTPRWGTLRRLAVTGVVVLGGLSPLTTLNLWAYGGMGYMTPAMARGIVYGQAELSSKGVSVFPNDYAAMNLDAAKHALAAPLWERYPTNASQTCEMLIFGLATLFIAHLLPVVVRRRIRRARLRDFARPD